MGPDKELKPLLQGLNKHDFNIVTLDDEIRVDQRCVDMLRRFRQDLTRQQGLTPEQAGAICLGADYFLREFMIADRRDNIFTASEERVRQFAGHWYIIRTPEPNLGELSGILRGTALFYGFLAEQGLIDRQLAQDIARQCDAIDYYQRRIDDFWAIQDDGFDAWRRACPLEPVPDIS
jgi:hypothetical protein